jgi:hypothetical protein
MNGCNIPFINYVKYIGVIFDRRIMWRLHIEMTETKTFKTFFGMHALFKSGRLSTNIKPSIKN